MKKYAAGSILSVPSWVIPGTYAENLGFLETKKEVEGVELLFYIYNDVTKKELESEWETIKSYSERFVFTAHLPEKELPFCRDLAARLTPLVKHFIVHPPKENPGEQAQILADWKKQFNAVFLAENTNNGLLETFLPHVNGDHVNGRAEPVTGICMDTGHLLLEGKSPAEFYKKYRGRISEIHLHTIDREKAAADGRLPDHRRLQQGQPWLTELLPLLDDYRGVINLEVFSWEEAAAGIEIIGDTRH